MLDSIAACYIVVDRIKQSNRKGAAMKYKNDISKQENLIRDALDIIEGRLKGEDKKMTSSQDTKNFLLLKMSGLEREHFKVLFLNAQHELIADETLFKGTIDSAAIYPREVAKAALNHNAAAVILAHNHPSGTPEPSSQDISITHKLCDALDLLDIRVLDHIVVGATDTVSFAERGIL